MKVLNWVLLTALYAVSLIVAQRYDAITYLLQNDSSCICCVLLAALGSGSAFAFFGKTGWVRFLANQSTVLGLGGTIYGLMDMFKDGMGDVAQLGPGIATALNTTMMGLVVAIMLALYAQVQDGGKKCD